MGARCGVVAGARFSRAGGRDPQEDSWPAGQWQFRKVNRPQRECCLFFGGGGHEDGPQPWGKSPELEKRGRGAREPDIAYPLSRFRHNRKLGCGFPGGSLPHPPTSSLRSPTAPPLPAAYASGSLPRRLDFWPSPSTRLFLRNRALALASRPPA